MRDCQTRGLESWRCIWRKLVELLQNGGPPMHCVDSERISWTLEKAIREHGRTPDEYPKAQYRTDYREAFLAVWCEQIAEAVERRPNGEILIHGSVSTCFPSQQSPGAARGSQDARSLLSGLLASVLHERLARSEHVQVNNLPPAQGVFSVWNSARDRRTPSADAVVYLFERFAVQGNRTGAIPAR